MSFLNAIHDLAGLLKDHAGSLLADAEKLPVVAALDARLKALGEVVKTDAPAAEAEAEKLWRDVAAAVSGHSAPAAPPAA